MGRRVRLLKIFNILFSKIYRWFVTGNHIFFKASNKQWQIYFRPYLSWGIALQRTEAWSPWLGDGWVYTTECSYLLVLRIESRRNVLPILTRTTCHHCRSLNKGFVTLIWREPLFVIQKYLCVHTDINSKRIEITTLLHTFMFTSDVRQVYSPVKQIPILHLLLHIMLIRRS